MKINLGSGNRPIIGYENIDIQERVFEQLVRDGDQDQIYRAVVTYDCRYLKS